MPQCPNSCGKEVGVPDSVPRQLEQTVRNYRRVSRRLVLQLCARAAHRGSQACRANSESLVLVDHAEGSLGSCPNRTSWSSLLGLRGSRHHRRRDDHLDVPRDMQQVYQWLDMGAAS